MRTDAAGITWGNPKEAADLVGINVARFRREWIPEDGPAQVDYCNPNGKSGPGRRPEVNLDDLERVMVQRTRKRAG